MTENNGPETISHMIVYKELTVELVTAFCYSYVKELPKLQPQINTKVLQSVNNRTIFHQRINPPFPVIPRVSIMNCQYNIHNFETDEFIMIVSSTGNEQIVKENISLIGSDNVGEIRLIMYRFKPIKDQNN